ncbi:hypothetical protein ACFL6S_18775 [Candidatus Poribacteria bacterium]
MKNSRIKKITMWERRTKTDVNILEAMINDNGDLALEGYDLGEAPKKFWGDSDYEYGRVVKKKYKDKILRLLIKERFGTDSDLKKWLDEKGIPNKLSRTISRGYRDTVLLWLIKEQFDTESDFSTWLDEEGIPNEFWSWI